MPKSSERTLASIAADNGWHEGHVDDFAARWPMLTVHEVGLVVDDATLRGQHFDNTARRMYFPEGDPRA